MSRLIFFLFLIVAGILFWRSRNGKNNKPSAPSTPPPDDMLPCCYCGIHAPRREGVSTHGYFYCCPEHMQLGQNNRTT